MKKTYSELFTFINTATRWLKENKGESKFRYAVNKVVKAQEKVLAGYQEKIDDINIDFCSEDENGIIRKDAQGGFQYTKENLRKRNAAIRKLQDEKVVVVPFTASTDGVVLSESEIEAFTGFVIAAGPVEFGTDNAVSE